MVLGAAEALRAFAVGRGAAVDILSDRRRSDEAHGLNVGIVQNRIDGFLVAIDDVQDAFRQPGFEKQFGKAHRHAGITLRWLEDIGVACRKCRRHLPQRDHGREIERRDAGDDAERLTHGIDVDAGARAFGVFALHHMRRTDADLDHVETALDIAARVGNGFAVLAGQKFGEFVKFALHEIEELDHHAHPALRVRGRPFGLSRVGDFDGLAHFGFRGQRHFLSRTVPSMGCMMLAVRPLVPATRLPPMK